MTIVADPQAFSGSPVYLLLLFTLDLGNFNESQKSQWKLVLKACPLSRNPKTSTYSGLVEKWKFQVKSFEKAPVVAMRDSLVGQHCILWQFEDKYF